jgi:hypothetical protein
MTRASTCLTIASAGLASVLPSAQAETVAVKYHGSVQIDRMHCEQIMRSSFIRRVCYDSKSRYLVVNLAGSYYHYCRIPPRTVTAWFDADSMGRHYNAHIKGEYDCRLGGIPSWADK